MIIKYKNCAFKFIKKDSSGALSFTCNSDSGSVALNQVGGGSAPSLQYKVDYGDWTDWDCSAVTLSKGNTMYVRGVNSTFSTSSSVYNQFELTGTINANGNIMSMINYQDMDNAVLTSFCFCNLFKDCNTLATAPQLPSTTLVNNCYYQMFYGCSSLTIAPSLPATTMAAKCCMAMFYNCKSLTTVPLFAATTLADTCFSNMFYGCKKLTSVPTLEATTLVSKCYNAMFYDCTSLTSIKAMFLTTPSADYTNNFLTNVAANGVFYKNPTATWDSGLERGIATIPEDWTIESAS